MAETATTPTTHGFSISGLFENPDFLRMLAGIGAEMDPQGAGGILGRAATTMIKSKAAAKAGEQTLNEDGEVTRKLGPLTPKGTQGPNKITRKSNGSLDIDVDHSDPAKLVDTLGGYTPLGQEGINSLSRTPSGSLLVNYDPPKQRLVRENPISTELASLEAAPTAARDRNKLSYTPISPNSVQDEIDDTLSPFAMRRRRV